MPLFPSDVDRFKASPLVVAYGLGVDSTAMLVEFAIRDIRPDLFLFADTSGEKPETYQYLDVIQPFLRRVGFPEVIVVRYQPKWAVYHTLEEQCLHTGTLPSLAYGGGSCAIKYKRVPQDKYVAGWLPARRCWARGGKVTKAIGFDAGPASIRGIATWRMIVSVIGTLWSIGAMIAPVQEDHRASGFARAHEVFLFLLPSLEEARDRLAPRASSRPAGAGHSDRTERSRKPDLDQGTRAIVLLGRVPQARGMNSRCSAIVPGNAQQPSTMKGTIYASQAQRRPDPEGG